MSERAFISQMSDGTFSQVSFLPSDAVSDQPQSIGSCLIAVTVGCRKHMVKYVGQYDIQNTG